MTAVWCDSGHCFFFFLLQLLNQNASDSACSVVAYLPSGKTFTSANQLRTVMLCPSEFLRPCGGILFLLIFWTVCFILMENLVIYTYTFVTVSRHLQTCQSASTASLLSGGLTEEQEIQDGTISFHELKENFWRDVASISGQTSVFAKKYFQIVWGLLKSRRSPCKESAKEWCKLNCRRKMEFLVDAPLYVIMVLR